MLRRRFLLFAAAILTASLCALAGLSWELTVGILVPTTNMHAWCTTGGVVPYEPERQHWIYSPLVIFNDIK